MKNLILKKREVSKSKGYSIDYKSELNDSQYEAVMHNDGASLVIAGAGTGKTRTLIYRVARLIEDGIPPNQILLLTFTRKASKEMIDRASKLLDGRASKISGGTFHSFALNILKFYADKINYPKNFVLMDIGDAEDSINLIRNRFVSKNRGKVLKKRFPSKGIIHKIYSASVNRREGIDEIINNQFNYYSDNLSDIEAILEEYSDFKKKSGLMDYDDLLQKLFELLKKVELANEISRKFKYLMIDEYQDTNRIQHEIALKLAGEKSNIMAVGDDAQSIYSFRGAEHQNIFFFPENFVECKVFKIQENYRSTKPILDFTNEIINKAEFKYEKKLFTQKEDGDKPFIITAKDERQQSEFIIQQVLNSREEGEDLNDIAILYRSNFLSIDLEIELNKANIPYRKFGGLKFMETAHVKDLLAFMKVIYNPLDVVSWGRILSLIKNVGPKTIEKITDLIANKTLNLENYQEILSGIRNKDLIFENFAKLKKLNRQLEPVILVKKISKDYITILKAKYEDSDKRLKDLEMLEQIATRYNNLESFLNELAIDPVSGSVQDIEAGNNEDEFLTLTTIHSAKGLEWKRVYIIWALDGRFPASRAADSIDSLEEERRLFYVASTRAKDELFISYPTNIFDTESGFVLSKPSRFISDVSDDLTERFTLVEED